jgi:predicted Zn-ribbon and HTH transcriptional regulator
MANNIGDNQFYDGNIVVAPLSIKIDKEPKGVFVSYNVTGFFTLLSRLLLESLTDEELCDVVEIALKDVIGQGAKYIVSRVATKIANHADEVVRGGISLTVIQSLGIIMPKHCYEYIKQYGDNVKARPTNCKQCGISEHDVIYRLSRVKAVSDKIESARNIILAHE